MVNCVQQITRTFSYSTSGSLFIKTEPFHFQLFPALHNYYCLLYLSIWLFYGPHISEFTQCLSCCVLIISLSTIPLRIIYAVACARISLLFKGWVIVYVGHFVCHLFASWYLHCFYFSSWLLLLWGTLEKPLVCKYRLRSLWPGTQE